MEANGLSVGELLAAFTNIGQEGAEACNAAIEKGTVPESLKRMVSHDKLWHVWWCCREVVSMGAIDYINKVRGRLRGGGSRRGGGRQRRRGRRRLLGRSNCGGWRRNATVSQQPMQCVIPRACMRVCVFVCMRVRVRACACVHVRVCGALSLGSHNNIVVPRRATLPCFPPFLPSFPTVFCPSNGLLPVPRARVQTNERTKQTNARTN
jgi:hypothetical protein